MFKFWQTVRSSFLRTLFTNPFPFTWILLLNLFAAVLEGASFGFILLALSSLGSQTALQPHILPFSNASWLADYIARLSPEEIFTRGIILAVLTQILRSAFNYCAQIATTAMSANWQIFLQKRIYEQILRLSFSCASRYKVGDLVEYARTPATMLYPVMDHSNKALVAFLAILALIGTMFFLSPLLTVLAVGIFGVLGFMQRTIIRRLSGISKKFSAHLAEFSKDGVQTLHGLRAVFTFDRQNEILRKTSSLLDKIASLTKKMSLWNSAISPINEISGVLLVGFFLILGQWLNHSISTLPVLLTFITIVYRLNTKVQALFTSLGSIANCWGQVVRIEDILNDKDKEFAPHAGAPFKKFDDAIVFQDVTLCYPGRSIASINALHWAIPKGKVTALVGLSGAGKSSILDLLLRLYEPSSGVIFVDGKPLKEYEVGSWRRTFGVVSQDVFIFNETIEENIRFGQEDLSSEQIISAARRAGAHDFILLLPQGYQTLVGERGYRLSGGERQRLALARALARDPEILILDEATSNLDSKSEQLIKRALLDLQEQKTLVIVAHRLSTIIHADQIVVLENGQVKEQGVHQELLEKDGLYAKLWNMQSQKVDIEKCVSI